MADDAAPTLEQLQDLLLDSPGFSEFLLGLTTISASLLGSRETMLCAITVEHDDAPATVASSSDAARGLDEKQYAFDDGPCLTALRHQRTVLVADLNTDERWTHYAAAIATEGVCSVLAVPIETSSSASAALNCYARTLGVFDESTVAAVERHARLISKTLRLALRLHVPEPFPEHLRSALQSRAVVEAAVSLVMLQNQCGRDQALSLLHLAALNDNKRLQDIAVSILETSRSPSSSPGPSEDGLRQ